MTKAGTAKGATVTKAQRLGWWLLSGSSQESQENRVRWDFMAQVAVRCSALCSPFMLRAFEHEGVFQGRALCVTQFGFRQISARL